MLMVKFTAGNIRNTTLLEIAQSRINLAEIYYIIKKLCPPTNHQKIPVASQKITNSN